MAIFASVVAPFGGFFASGFKRAFKIKDFGDLIPGHGGVVDRMDCQIVMGMFAYLYYTSFIQPQFPGHNSAYAWQSISHMSGTEQLELYKKLQSSLDEQGLLP